jgi:hypothetical protein
MPDAGPGPLRPSDSRIPQRLPQTWNSQACCTPDLDRASRGRSQRHILVPDVVRANETMWAVSNATSKEQKLRNKSYFL